MAAKELKRNVSAAVAPREEYRKLSLSLFSLPRTRGKRLFNLVHQLQPFRSKSLGISLSFFFLLLFSLSLLPFSFVLGFIHSLPSYRASFVFVVNLPSFQRLFRISFPSVPPQRYDQINVTIDPSVPLMLLLPRLAPSFHPLSTSVLYERRAFTNARYSPPIIAPPTGHRTSARLPIIAKTRFVSFSPDVD